LSAQTSVSGGTTVKRSPKKKKNQLPIAIGLLIVVIVLAVVFGQISKGLVIAWIFGIGFGVVLQKSRFCFTAAFRDPVLTGGTSLSKAVLLTLGIALVGFGVIQFISVQAGKGVPGGINPAGWHVAIGALMFGIGAVISGGCASGTLMRVGEGFMMQWLSLIFFIIGSLWGARDFGWWNKFLISSSPKAHLPSVLGWPLAFVLQLAVLGGLYFLADWWGKRKSS
jgi:uncharacterized membrane protein YedE/YeeE